MYTSLHLYIFILRLRVYIHINDDILFDVYGYDILGVNNEKGVLLTYSDLYYTSEKNWIRKLKPISLDMLWTISITH